VSLNAAGPHKVKGLHGTLTTPVNTDSCVTEGE